MHQSSDHKVIYRQMEYYHSEQLIRADIGILTIIIHIISKISLIRHPESLLEILPYKISYRTPFSDKLFIRAVSLLHFDGEAEDIIPECVRLDLISCTLCHRIPVYVCVHPGQCRPVFLRPQKPVRLERNLLPVAWSITLDDTFHDITIFLPDFLP